MTRGEGMDCTECNTYGQHGEQQRGAAVICKHMDVVTDVAVHISLDVDE